MKKFWAIKKERICLIIGQTCGDAVSEYKESLAIDCSDCTDYKRFKDSGKTLDEYQKDELQ